MRTLFCLGFLACLTGCASFQANNTILVTFNSVPSGAMLVQNGVILGQMPLTMEAKISSSDISRGSWQSPPVSAWWSSGASSIKSPLFAWNPGQSKVTGQTVFNRPVNAANLEADLAVETRLRRDAEPTPEELAMWNSLGQSLGTAAALAAHHR